MKKSNTLIRFDWAIKRLLRQKSNFTVLEGFLSVILNEEVKIVSIKESEGNQEHIQDKFNRVDIFVENSHGELLIIELQNCEQVDYFLRMLYGASKAITEHISLGNPYSNVRKVYHINIVYFALGKGKDYVYYGSTEFRGLHYNDVLQLTKDEKDFFAEKRRKSVKEVKDLFPVYYILCVKGFDDVAKNSLDEWMYYLKNNDVPAEFTAPGLKEVRKRLQYDKLSEADKLEYKHHLIQTLHEQSSIDTALYRGKQEGKAERDCLKVELEAAQAEKEAAHTKLEAVQAEKEAIHTKLEAAQAEKEAIHTKWEAAQAEKEAAQKSIVLNMHRSGFSTDAISSMTNLPQEVVISIVEV